MRGPPRCGGPPRRLAAKSRPFEYITAGKPILCIGGDNASASIVREYRLGLVMGLDPTAIGDAPLAAATRAASRQHIVSDPGLQGARVAFSSKTLAAKFANLLAHTVEGGGAF